MALAVLGIYALDPADTWMVGDRGMDIEAGRAAGLGTCLFGRALPMLKRESKERRGTHTGREYGVPQTPYLRVLRTAAVSAAEQARLQTLPATLNPFQRGRDRERQMKQIEARRRRRA